MWNRRDDSNVQTKQPEVHPPSPAPVSNNNMTSRPASPAFSAARNPEGAAIGRAVKVRGDIISREDLYVDGEVDGTLMLEEHRLTVGPSGKIRANIKAREVTIRGSVHGNVEAAEKITIHKDGQLVGDMKMAGIVIEDGAYFKGSIDITRPEKQ